MGIYIPYHAECDRCGFDRSFKIELNEDPLRVIASYGWSGIGPGDHVGYVRCPSCTERFKGVGNND